MSKYESNVKQVAAPQSAVYAKLSDLSNLESLRQRINDPMAQEAMKSKIPEDKFEDVKKYLESVEVTTDSISMDVNMMGRMTINVLEREPEKCVKYGSDNQFVPFKLWIQMLPTSSTTSKIRVTLDADIPIFLKPMIGNKLKDGVEKMADMLAMLPY